MISGPANLEFMTKPMEAAAERGAERAMEAAGDVLVGIAQQNIDMWGDRPGGPGKWARVPVPWLIRRETWPGGPPERELNPATGKRPFKFTARQRGYIQSHTPLRDTDTLYNSIQSVAPQRSGDLFSTFARPTVPYALQHITGNPGPGGPKQLHKRDFLFISPQDDVRRLELAQSIAFGGEFNG